MNVAGAVACHFMVGVFVFLSAQADPADGPADAPAVIVNPSAESRRELSRVIGSMLHIESVTLADDALTASNVLSLEHANPRDSLGRRLNGRELSRPETFELVKRESRCVLVQLRTGRARTLRHVHCAARVSPP